MDPTEAELRLECSDKPARGKWTVTLTLPDGRRYVDTVNLLDARRREAFLAAAKAIFAELPQAKVREGLASMASQAAARTEERAKAAGESEPDGPDGSDGPTADMKQRDMIVRIVEDARASGELELFMTPEAAETEVYVTLHTKHGRRTCPVRSSTFETWMHRAFKSKYACSPSMNALKEAVFSTCAMLEVDDPRHPVFVRIGELDGVLWVDLCDDHQRAVRVRGGRWEVVAGTDVLARFIRKPGMSALPIPGRGGSISLLRSLVYMPDDEMFVLYVLVIVGFFHPTGPYAALDISGEKGSTKTTCSWMARELVDPNLATLRLPPREARDLVVAARSGHVLMLENMDMLPRWLSDMLAAILTGTGVAGRQLYTDDGEVLVQICKPLIINGIDLVITRPDLLERTVCLHLERLPDELRLELAEVRARFEAAKARILGVILDGVAAAHAGWRSVKLPGKPRMADFASWAVAAEGAFGWPEGTFMKAYAANGAEGQRAAIDASPIGPAVLEFMETVDVWEGTCGDLLPLLGQTGAIRAEGRGRDWPNNERSLRAQLTHIAASLRFESIDVEFGKRSSDSTRRRLVVLRKLGPRPSGPSRPSDDDDESSARGIGARSVPDSGQSDDRPKENRIDRASGGLSDGSDGPDGARATKSMERECATSGDHMDSQLVLGDEVAETPSTPSGPSKSCDEGDDDQDTPDFVEDF